MMVLPEPSFLHGHNSEGWILEDISLIIPNKSQHWSDSKTKIKVVVEEESNVKTLEHKAHTVTYAWEICDPDITRFQWLCLNYSGKADGLSFIN